MTSSDRLRPLTARGLSAGWVLGIFLATPVAHAALGESENHVEQDRMRFGAHRSSEQHFQYRKHLLAKPDGTRIRQFVGAQGQVFAVTWQTPYKPDLDQLLGDAAPGYAQAARAAVRQAGPLRQFHHSQGDVVVQSSAYLNKHVGYAYRRSLVPPGFELARLGRD